MFCALLCLAGVEVIVVPGVCHLYVFTGECAVMHALALTMQIMLHELFMLARACMSKEWAVPFS